MIALHARAAPMPGPLPRRLWRVADGSAPARPEDALLANADNTDHAGYALVLAPPGQPAPASTGAPVLVLPAALHHVQAGDILSVSPTGDRISVLYRARSGSNSILLTEQCDNYCLMCSQPPKKAADGWLLDRARALLRLIPPDAPSLGLTGGEPTLHGQGLLDLLADARDLLPNTELHLLSNGRRFSDPTYADGYATAAGLRLMVGIPLYGPEPSLHDYVVQAHGAFDETVRGILNLALRRQRVEIRVVVHRQTAEALPDIADYIARNLPFVEQVALMGLEMMGLARANADTVWIDPVEYQGQLYDAATRLQHAGVTTRIYNHQLCLLDRRLWPLAVKSISDWKNDYLPECQSCAVRHDCGGLFASAKYRSSPHIKALR